MTHITATFKNGHDAEAVLARLEAAGIDQTQISVLMTDETRHSANFRIEQNSKADEGAAAGATLGGIVGGVLAAIMGAGTIAIPGLNLVVIGGLASGLAGLGAGAAAGGLVGALIGAGIPEHEAKIYETQVEGGNILVAVKPDNNAQKQRVKDVFENSQAYNIAA